jgi:hypothetical protein
MRSLRFLPTFATLATALVVAVGCARSESVIALDRGGEDVDRLYDANLRSEVATDHINSPRIAGEDVRAALDAQVAYLDILVGVPSLRRNRPRRALTRACCDVMTIRPAGCPMDSAPHLCRSSEYRAVTTSTARFPCNVCLFAERFCTRGQSRVIESPCEMVLSRRNDYRSVRQASSSEIINHRRDS